MPNPLELRLRQLSRDFARRVAGIISALTIEELAALCGEDGVSVAKTRRKKTRPALKPKPKARRKAKPTPEAAAIPSSSIRRSLGEGGQTSTEPPPAPPHSRHSPQGEGGQPPEDRAAAFLRSERERLETAVLKFVSQNPGTDAEIVAVRVGLPKGKAQEVLDDLVLCGKLRMKLGQLGRCYVGV